MPHVLPLVEAFATLPDPRVARTRFHALTDILFIAVCALLCGAESFDDIEDWGRTKEAWLRQHLALPHGIPSHDTFNRVFARLDPEAFTTCFLQWVEGFRVATPGEIVALDGKTLRHSFDTAGGRGAIHVVSAWASENRLVLGQVKVSEKSNEITALPALLALLEVQGCIVTIDAMGCQKAIARQIIQQEADYVLALKGNQSSLWEDVSLYLDAWVAQELSVPGPTLRTADFEHGRQEIRYYWLTNEVAWLKERHGAETWVGLRSIGLVESHRRAGGPGTPITVERRYFISSLPGQDAADVARFARAVRKHWGIENQVHWVLDVAFREDDCRVRKDHAPQNLATVRHFVLNLLRQDRTVNRGIKGKRLKAGWDERYLTQLLGI
jgi:predicted transposase YbfD/YdcC